MLSNMQREMPIYRLSWLQWNLLSFCYTVLVWEAKDLLVLLCYHAKNLSRAIYFRPKPKLHSKGCRVWDIQKTRYNPKETTCEYILFSHAIFGCDTTPDCMCSGSCLVIPNSENMQKSFFWPIYATWFNYWSWGEDNYVHVQWMKKWQSGQT